MTSTSFGLAFLRSRPPNATIAVPHRVVYAALCPKWGCRWVKQHGWLDPDFLMTLYPVTMGFTESRTEYTFWSLWSSPLIVSTDIRKYS